MLIALYSIDTRTAYSSCEEVATASWLVKTIFYKTSCSKYIKHFWENINIVNNRDNLDYVQYLLFEVFSLSFVWTMNTSGQREAIYKEHWAKNRSSLPTLLFCTCFTVKKAFQYSRPQPGCHLPNSPWAGIMMSHRKKGFSIFPSQPGCHLSNSPWTGIIYIWHHNSRPGRAW
jgi:hypothetical protein